MARAKTNKVEQTIATTHVVDMPVEEIMNSRFGEYAKYIIQERALPDVRDGLKPVQRRILYAMNKEGNTFEKAYRKSAKTVGNVIGNYHPHGDSSVYEAMVRMSQDWKMNIPLIDMQGNNGSIDDDPAAAMRYTEARLAKEAGILIEDLEKDTVNWSPNFDDTEMEPIVFPAKYPNILVNGTTGIAAGYATNIPPHNLKEIVDATIYRISNPECTLKDIMKIIKGPDFPTGGIVQGAKGIEDAFKTGRGKVVVRAKTEIVEQKMMNQIIITEIPYEVIKVQMVKKMDDIRLNKEVDGIIDIRDESDRNGLRIVVDLKKDISAQEVLKYFYTKTELQSSYNYNMVAIVDKRPVQMGILPILDAYIKHREEVVTRRTNYELAKKKERCHILEGLIKAISVLDEVIAIIRKSKDKADSKKALIERFGFTEAQAEAIVVLRLYRLSSTDVKELKAELTKLKKEIKELEAILKDRNKLLQVIISELNEVGNTYGKARKTKIEKNEETIVINTRAMIPNERTMITASVDGYIKRCSIRSYASSEGPTGIKEGDSMLCYHEVSTLDTMLLFTNQGRFVSLPVYQLDEGKWKDVGTHVNTYAKLNPNEKIVETIFVQDFKDEKASVIMTTANGMMKQTAISEFEVQRNSKAFLAMKLKDEDSVVSVRLCSPEQEIAIITKKGMMVRYDVSDVPQSAARSAGVKAMNLKNDTIVDTTILKGNETGLLLVTEKSQMKRLKLEASTKYRRPAKGEAVCKAVKSNPPVLRYVMAVIPDDEVVLYGDEIVELKAKDIPFMDKTGTFTSAKTKDASWYLGRKIVKQ